MHSHNYRRAEGFTGESVLIIGAGPSAFDLVTDISKFAKVMWSHHQNEPLVMRLNENVKEKADVKEITENAVVFNDGSSNDCTTIIYCTGYNCSFPFLSVDCGIKCEDNFIRPLFKH